MKDTTDLAHEKCTCPDHEYVVFTELFVLIDNNRYYISQISTENGNT